MRSESRLRRLLPWVAGVPIALVGVCGALAQLGLAQDTKSDTKTAQLFQSSCASCHTVPDVRFATDKAWLGQVLETA